MKNREPVVGYMCKVDWEYELGNASGGNRVYPSIADLKKNSPCWEECGVVQVEVQFKRIVKRGKI